MSNATRSTVQRACLHAGLGTMIAATAFLVIGVMIPGFAVEFELYDGDYSFNFSAFLYIALIFAGLVVASLYFKSPDVRFSIHAPQSLEEGFTSMPRSRMLAGGVLLATGVLCFVAFGVEFSDENVTGMWLFLGGPSLSFPTGLLPVVLGLVLVIYGAAAIKRVTFHRKDGVLHVNESRLLHNVFTTIPAGDVKVAHLSNSRTGPRLLWIPLLAIPAYLLLVDGVSFLSNPFSFGTAYLAGAMYVLSASVHLAALLLLLFGGNHVLTIVTSTQVYEMHFFPPKNAASLNRLLGLAPGNAATMHHPADYTRLVTGIVLVGLAIVSRVFYFHSSDVHRFAMLVLGGILLVEGIKRDVSFGKGTVHSSCDGATPPSCRVESSRGCFHDEYVFNDVDAGALASPAPRSRRLLFHDHLVVTGLAASTGFETCTALLLHTSSNPHAAEHVATHVIVAVVMVCLLLACFAGKRPLLEATMHGKRFQVLARSGGEHGVSWWNRAGSAIRRDLRDSLPVLVEIAVAFIAGMVGSIALFLG